MSGKYVFAIFAAWVLLGTCLFAQEDRLRDDRRRWRGPPPGQMPWQMVERQRAANAEKGYAFIDKELISAPYVVKSNGDGFTINDRPIAGLSDRRVSAHELAGSLQNNGVLVAFTGSPSQIFNDVRLVECLRVIASEGTTGEQIESFVASLPADVNRQEWSEWLAEYRLPEPHRAVAAKFVELSDAARVEGEKSIAANQRLSTWAYPLTVFGMLMSVVSFGHLLQFPPRGNPDLVPSRRRAELCRATVIFLVMVVVLSGLDLLWTLLTSQAGQMHELNPIGQQLMDDPWMLSLFKGVATLASCGLLLMLRRHPRAQLASWWLCLVCTLLTFRWLVLNSMFVA